MRLKLKELQKVVEETISEERAADTLREEVSRVLGPSVITNVKLESLAEGANDRIDVLERTGRDGNLNFKTSILLKFANSPIAEVRRLVARTIPEQFVARFKSDKDASVRHAVARRSSLGVIKEMLRREPGNDELRQIYRQKKLNEAGVPSPKQQDSHLDMYNEKLGDSAKQSTGPELSDQWYSMTAHKAISDYHHNIEGMWDEPWAHRYCASIKATSGVDVDEKKLWGEIQKQLKDRDDRTLERYALKEVARHLKENSEHEFVVYTEETDPVQDLIESDLSSIEYVKKANSVFGIRESSMPKGLRKYMVAEGYRTETMIPCNGKTPGNRHISRLDERALDLYVKRWNDVQKQRGEPIRIDWSTNPMAPGTFSFSAELK